MRDRRSDQRVEKMHSRACRDVRDMACEGSVFVLHPETTHGPTKEITVPMVSAD